MPAHEPPAPIAAINAAAEVPPPSFATIPPTVGTSVGYTTPSAELTHESKPAETPIIGAAVLGVIMLASKFERRSIPPISLTRFISTPTPKTSITVFQGTALITDDSSATLKNTSTAPTKNAAKPTFIFTKIINISIAKIPRSEII
ncbi:hypothetical protein SDC9_127871 [bioreactor metagenome]|uniref:Uncharacterized protein n=1 Tax=bioreactor metagenome TaxID=1076179 RepID=A0A645CV91_9ZZZZ